MSVLAVDTSAVGAFQIGQNQLLLIFLDLDMKATDALIVELNRIAFLAANRNRRRRPSKTWPRSAPSRTLNVIWLIARPMPVPTTQFPHNRL